MTFAAAVCTVLQVLIDYVVQQTVQYCMNVLLLQEGGSLSDRVLCVTFGAPPSSLTPLSGETAHQVSQNPEKSGLFWNFLLANAHAAPQASMKQKVTRKVFHKMTLADVLPAVMSTCPTSTDSSVQWLNAVTDVETCCKLQYTPPADFQSSIDELLAAGKLNEDHLVRRTTH